MKLQKLALISFTFIFTSISIFNAAQANNSELFVGSSDENPTGSTAISAENLVASYNFESYTSDGQLKDFSTFGNHGKIKRKKETMGLFGKARIFENLEDVIDLPESASLDLDGPLTITAWLQLSKANMHQHILSCDDIYVLWTTEANQYRLADTQGHGFVSKPGSTSTETWHSVTAILYASSGEELNNNNIKIFIDGEQVEGDFTDKWTPATLRPVNGCLIGASSSLSKAHQELEFKGIVDELQVFSRALTDAEIKAYANRKK